MDFKSSGLYVLFIPTDLKLSAVMLPTCRTRSFCTMPASAAGDPSTTARTRQKGSVLTTGSSTDIDASLPADACPTPSRAWGKNKVESS